MRHISRADIGSLFRQRRRWGNWRFLKRSSLLIYRSPGGRAPKGFVYDITIGDLQNPLSRLSWIAHLNEKRWLDDGDFRDFIKALGDLGMLRPKSGRW